MEQSFGEKIKKYRRDSHDSDRGGSLTQERLAERIGARLGDATYPGAATLAYWEANKNLPDAFKRRDALIAMIGVFVQAGAIKSVEEANQFLASGRYSALEEEEQRAIWGTKKDADKTSASQSSALREKSIRDQSKEPGQRNLVANLEPSRPGDKPKFRGDPLDDLDWRPPTATLAEVNERIKELLRRTSPESISRAGTAPRPPSLIIGRDGDLRELKKRFGIGAPKPNLAPVQVLTSTRPSNEMEKALLTTMRGLPGIGKTTLASALAYDSEVIDSFPDGILWVSLGLSPDVFSHLAAWGRALHIDLAHAKNVEQASAQLAAHLRGKRMLLIVDDVWKTALALPFQIGGPNCAMLITTRDRAVARDLAPTPDDIYRLDVLSDENAFALLRVLAPKVVEQHPDESQVLVRELEGLPLAIQVAGHLLQSESELGFSVVDLLSELRGGARLLAAPAPADQTDLTKETTPTVAALFNKSTDHLDPTARDCFAYLGPLAPKPATFDLETMQAIWQVDDPKPIMRILVDRGLLEPVLETGRFQMHSLLVMHAKSLLTPH